MAPTSTCLHGQKKEEASSLFSHYKHASIHVLFFLRAAWRTTVAAHAHTRHATTHPPLPASCLHLHLAPCHHYLPHTHPCLHYTPHALPTHLPAPHTCLPHRISTHTAPHHRATLPACPSVPWDLPIRQIDSRLEQGGACLPFLPACHHLQATCHLD